MRAHTHTESFVFTVLSLLLLAASETRAQGPGGGGGGGGGQTCTPDSTIGSASATGCPTVPNNQCIGGNNNYVSFGSSSYAPDSNGRYTVSMKTNQCPNNAKTGFIGGLSSDAALHGPPPCCTTVSLPVGSKVSSSALAAPLRNAIGYSIFGVQIFSVMENGFALGFACDNNLGSCVTGVDVEICKMSLERQCGTDHVSYSKLLDDCGAHATPYHFHRGFRCEYAYANSSAHSPLIALMLDGRGFYGQWESNGELPTLDACGGHVGPTPDSLHPTTGTTFSGGASVYHYHAVDGHSATIACYGPVASMAAAKALYATCDTGYVDVCTNQGNIHFDDDCPIYGYQTGGPLYNQNFTATPACSIITNITGEPDNTPTGGRASLSKANAGATLALVVLAAMCWE